MARSYTSRTILDGGQAKEEDFNSEIQTPLQEFNGQLDGHQLPLQQVTHTHLAQPTVDQTYIASDGTPHLFAISLPGVGAKPIMIHPFGSVAR